MTNWIPLTGPGSRIPTREDADEHGLVRYQNHRVRWMGLWNGSRVEYDNEPATHWHSLPLYTPPKPGPTDTECKELIYRITNEAWDESAVMEWFADVTARIEREKGK